MTLVQPVVEETATPIFDALASEVGLEWPESGVGWFEPGNESAGKSRA